MFSTLVELNWLTPLLAASQYRHAPCLPACSCRHQATDKGDRFQNNKALLGCLHQSLSHACSEVYNKPCMPTASVHPVKCRIGADFEWNSMKAMKSHACRMPDSLRPRHSCCLADSESCDATHLCHLCSRPPRCTRHLGSLQASMRRLVPEQHLTLGPVDSELLMSSSGYGSVNSDLCYFTLAGFAGCLIYLRDMCPCKHT